MGKYKWIIGVTAILLILILTISSIFLAYDYLSRPMIKIVNQSGSKITDIVLEVRNNSISIDSLPRGESRTLRLNTPFGESAMKLTYTLKGEAREWEGGYIESSGAYRVELTINSSGLLDEYAWLGWGELLFFVSDIVSWMDMNDYNPNEKDISRILSEFMLPDYPIEGLYGNYDVDSLIFRYKLQESTGTTATNLAKEIVKQAVKDNWQIVEQSEAYWRLSRIDSRRELYFHSVEEARITISPSGNLHIAYIQADTSDIVEKLEDAGAEYSFAKKTLWPKFENYVKQD